MISDGSGMKKKLRPGKRIRTLIVDDSATMRRLIRENLEEHPDIQVVAEARCARSARDAVNRYRPDVMTLDVEMPHMDGLEFLRRLMRARPMPVVMVSSLTRNGSRAAVKALSLGAVDCVSKQQMGAAPEFGNLADTVRTAAQATVRQPRNMQPTGGSGVSEYSYGRGIVLIGASTGGVEALERILERYPENCPPTLITQHMPAQFLVNFARRLNNLSRPLVKLGEDHEPIEMGKVLIAPGGAFHMTVAPGRQPHIALMRGSKSCGHRPSVDEMFRSAEFLGSRAIAVLLTGMGYDGAKAMLRLKNAGAFCIGQDQETCVVFGMPRVAQELGALDIQLPLDHIAQGILERTKQKHTLEDANSSWKPHVG